MDAGEKLLVPTVSDLLNLSTDRPTMLAVAKRILRVVVKIVAAGAGIVFVFDNRLSSTTGFIVLVGAIAVLLICLFIWLFFDLGENKGFSPDKPQ